MAEKQRLRIYFPDEGLSHNLLVTPVGPDLYRLEEASIFVDAAKFGDVLAVKRDAGGRFLFQGVVLETDFRSYTAVVTQKQTDTPAFEQLVAAVEAAGGTWSLKIGGILTISLPQTSDFDPRPALDRLQQ